MEVGEGGRGIRGKGVEEIRRGDGGWIEEERERDKRRRGGGTEERR
jgi:hypothetical protein